MNFLLIGHRGTGKSTCGQLLEMRPDVEVVDLDARVAAHANQGSCAHIIASQGIDRFRALEMMCLDMILSEPCDRPMRLVILGAGCMHLPSHTPIIWLHRDGWIESARHERARLRHDLCFEDEISWMQRTREPVWARHAHTYIHTSIGRTKENVSRQIYLHMTWLRDARQSLMMHSSYFVPGAPDDIERARQDAELFDAGIEWRSDLLGNTPLPATQDRILASLRHDDPSWLELWQGARAFDVDVRFFEQLLLSHTLTHMEPRTLILSTHPDNTSTMHVKELTTAAHIIKNKYPKWAKHLVLKFAPKVPDWRACNHALQGDLLLRKYTPHTTTIPQERRWAWLRPLRMAQGANATNYLPVGLNTHRFPELEHTKESRTQWSPYDLQDWLPHLCADPPEHFDALIGDPVDTSLGDLWHRAASFHEPTDPTGYLKIPIDAKIKDKEFKYALRVLHELGLRGLSVTAPHKRRILPLISRTTPHDLDAVNTLRVLVPHTCEERTSSDDMNLLWEGTDTDEEGMCATLTEFERLGIRPGTVAIIGQGGVSVALKRAIHASVHWTLAHHASAREGWTARAPKHVRLVINATGSHTTAYNNPPKHEAWLDLHYVHVRAPNTGVVHLNGDVFFEAQAHAQRLFWAQGTAHSRAKSNV